MSDKKTSWWRFRSIVKVGPFELFWDIATWHLPFGYSHGAGGLGFGCLAFQIVYWRSSVRE